MSEPTTESLCADVEAAPTLREDPCVRALCARAREQATTLDDHERNNCETCRTARAEREVTVLRAEVERLRVRCGPLSSAVVMTPTEWNDLSEKHEADVEQGKRDERTKRAAQIRTEAANYEDRDVRIALGDIADTIEGAT